MAEITLAAVHDSDTPPRALRGQERAAIVIHLDAAALPAVDALTASSDQAQVRSPERSRPAGRIATHPAASDATDPPGPSSEVADELAGSSDTGLPGRSFDLSDQPGCSGVVADEPAGSSEVGELRSREHTRPRTRDFRRPIGRIAGGPGLPDAVITRLLCAGRIRTVIRAHPGTIVDLGRSHRVVTERQYRALLARDHGACAFPGCDSTHGLEAHHVRHWIHGGPTDLTNLVLLCSAHHHAHHDGMFSIHTTRRGRFRFQRPDGRNLSQRVTPAALADTSTPIDNDHDHDRIRPDAATTRWDGSRIDRHYATACLAQTRQRSRDVSERGN
jgi:hypothetical protein